jgi:hypothetical protein
LRADSRLDRDLLVAIVHSGACPKPTSDEVRFYRVHGGRLRRLRPLVPQGPPQRAFTCLGPGADPCHVALSGSAVGIVGAFADAETHQQLPVVISLAKDSYRVWPLSVPPPAVIGDPEVREARRVNRKVVSLNLGGQEGARGHPAQAAAVLPAEGDRPAVVLTGYLKEGTPDAPAAMSVEAWVLKFDDGRPAVDRDCVMVEDGKPMKPGVTLSSLADLKAAILKRWKPASLVC